MALSGSVNMQGVAIQPTSNYLVPSSGGTHAVQLQGVLSGQAAIIDWRQFGVDDFPFQPQGVFIDNSAGAGEVTLSILTAVNGPVLWNVYCPAGAVIQSQFPAPDGQLASITGNGQCNLIFVDFPVLPNAGAVTIVGGSVGISGQPIQVTGSALALGNVPYQVTDTPPAASTPQYGSGSAAAAITITPVTQNQYLRKLKLALESTATVAAAGLVTLTVVANGVQVYKRNIYVPNAAADTPGQVWSDEIDFANIGIAMGAGNLTVTPGTALTAGAWEVNAYFA